MSVVHLTTISLYENFDYRSPYLLVVDGDMMAPVAVSMFMPMPMTVIMSMSVMVVTPCCPHPE